MAMTLEDLGEYVRDGLLIVSPAYQFIIQHKLILHAIDGNAVDIYSQRDDSIKHSVRVNRPDGLVTSNVLNETYVVGWMDDDFAISVFSSTNPTGIIRFWKTNWFRLTDVSVWVISVHDAEVLLAESHTSRHVKVFDVLGFTKRSIVLQGTPLYDGGRRINCIKAVQHLPSGRVLIGDADDDVAFYT